MPFTGDAKTAYQREYMRDYMRGRRAQERAQKVRPAGSLPPAPSNGATAPANAEVDAEVVRGANPERDKPEQPAGDEQLRRERDVALRQRDEAWRERDRMRRERDDAIEQRDDALRGVMPKPELVGDHIRFCVCSFCGKRGGDNPEVETMIVGSVRQRLFVCNECVEQCNGIIAEKRRRQATE
jgi:ClpX C4-type zinc finger protein